MPSARLALAARLILLLTPLLASGMAARADVGATLSLQSDARERGMSYSADRPAAQLGLAWDGDAGWYAGAALAQARFDSGRRGTWLRAYGGRVVELRPGLDGEAGLVVHRFDGVSRYNFAEVYAGLLGERWTLRLHHSPDYYGGGQRSEYGEFNLRWPLAQTVAALGHVGVLRSHGTPRWPPQYPAAHGPARIDLRLGAAWQLGESVELQLVWVSVSRGGPATWYDSTRRRTAVLGLTAAL